MSNISVQNRKYNITVAKYRASATAGLQIPFVIPGAIGSSTFGEVSSISISSRKYNINLENR